VPEVNVQSWKNLTGSRSSGIAYTNSSGYPITVSVVMSGSSASQDSTLSVGGVQVSRVLTNSGALGFGGTLTAIIPVGVSYTVNVITGMAVNSWAELS
jgi:hypothetical protein